MQISLALIFNDIVRCASCQVLGWPENNEILAVLDEVAVRQLLDLFLVERGLIGEVEGLQSLDEGEAGEAGAHGDVQAFQLGGGHGITSRPTRSSSCS